MNLTDPRPDLAYDTKEWAKFLTMAEIKDKTLAGVLHGFRCCGLRIDRTRRGYVLRPEVDPDTKISMWSCKNEYLYASHHWLKPYQNEIVELLERLNQKDGDRVA